MKILVSGARDYDNWPKVKEELDIFHEENNITTVVHGGARGVDHLSGVWARWNNIPEIVYPAKWKELGKAAGPIRNLEMLEKEQPDVVIAFLTVDSKGTKHMVTECKKKGVKCVVIAI